MTTKRIRILIHHFDQYIQTLSTTGKKQLLLKLKSQQGKYSGNRGKTVDLKFNHIKENYPEVLI